MGFLGARGTLVLQLAVRDFKQRYVGSLLGWLWGLVHPLVLLAVYTFLFRQAFGAKLPPSEATDSYPLFLLAGMLPWLLFSETLSRSATSLADYSALIKKSVFPSEAVPISVLASNGTVHLLSVGVLVCVGAATGHRPTSSLALLPVYAALLALLSLGLAWIAASLQVYLRDTAQVLSVALTAWFWMTPVFLPETFYQERIGVMLDWNPVRYAVLGYRGAILGGSPLRFADLCAFAAFTLGAFAVGAMFFRRAKRGFPEIM